MTSRLTALSTHSLSAVLCSIPTKAKHSPKPDTPVTTTGSKTSVRTPSRSSVTPTQPDSLFWCFYRITKGAIDYDMAQSSPTKTRMDTLIALSQRVMQEKALLRAHKLSASVVAGSMAGLQFKNNDFVASILCSGIDTVFLVGNMYMELCASADGNRHVVRFDESANSWVCESEVDDPSVAALTAGKLLVQSLDKPIGTVASYTKEQLEEMVNRLGLKLPVEPGKKFTKKSMHDSILAFVLQ